MNRLYAPLRFTHSLNLDGFRKVSYASNKNSLSESNDNLHFGNQYFIRGQYNQLHKIKRNAVGAKHRVTSQNSNSSGGMKTTGTHGKNVTLPEEDVSSQDREV